MIEPTVAPDSPKIKALRIERKWSQEFLAQKAGCSKRSIENAESGRRIKEFILLAIAGALEVTLWELTMNNRIAPYLTNGHAKEAHEKLASSATRLELQELIQELSRADPDPQSIRYIGTALLHALRLGRIAGASDRYFRSLDVLIGDIDEVRRNVTYPAAAHISVKDLDQVISELETLMEECDA